MARKAKRDATQRVAPTSAAPVPGPTVYDATCLKGGSVKRGKVITQAQAEALRQKGQDVVVCGPQHAANMALARDIEQNANGHWKRCGPHRNAGPNSLPHYQPDPRPPLGHTSYETANRHAL
jgi:hypothetical protein